MEIQMKKLLLDKAKEAKLDIQNLQLPDCALEPENIRAILINEVPPANPADSLYSGQEQAADFLSVQTLFHMAGLDIRSINDLVQKGIYITTAVKAPKDGASVAPEQLAAHLPLLEAEMELFTQKQVIFLAGDVAKRAMNLLAKKQTSKGAIPMKPTYKQRGEIFHYKDIRILPSYIVTGKNLSIERGKLGIIAEDLRTMLHLLDIVPQK